ncbi:MAG: hypothetical protein HOO99_03885 [Hyphomicrobiaceae bacterium]|nr:hypothetical protein [Hyphomicrobiaceae bacterium]
METKRIAENIFEVIESGVVEIVTGVSTAEQAVATYHEARQPPPVTDADYRAAAESLELVTAHQRDFDNPYDAAAYIQSTNATYHAEARAYVDWRDRLWGYVEAKLAQMKTDNVVVSVDEFAAGLPQITWP